ncbi:MAG: hypothetical protein U1C51_10060 [Candidatus Izemoplasmatales bacterium]|jgi:hypothetical protein|nr:hypothetical protein [bacterium]MDZ4197573.1 hypothetical protein [Candidatus Izemoplasmatales bacterium]
MRDERIQWTNGQIKQQVLWIISILALVSLGIKLALSYTDIIVELVYIGLMTVNIIGRVLIRYNDRIIDESIQKRRGIFTSKMFTIIALVCIALYFIQLPYLEVELILPANLFVSLSLFTGILSYFMIARKKQIYINATIIDLPLKQYHRRLWKRVGILFLFSLAIGVLSGGIYYLTTSMTEAIWMTLVVIFFSFVSVSLEYGLLSIYEKFHSDEMFEQIDGVVRYVPRTYVLISCILLFYYTLKTILIVLNQLDVLQLLHRFYYNLFQDIVVLFDVIYGIPLQVLAFIGFIVLYRSQLRQPTKKPSYFSVFKVLALLSMIYGIVSGLINHILYFIIRFGNPQQGMQLLALNSTISVALAMVISFISLISGLLIYSYMVQNHFPVSKLYLAIVITSFLSFWVTRFLYFQFSSSIQIRMMISLVSSIFTYVVMGILSLLLIVILSKRKRNILPVETVDQG